MQAKQEEGPSSRQQLDAESTAHAETRSKLAAAKAAMERKSALANELKAKLGELQKAEGQAGADAAARVSRAEQQVKDAQAALSRRDARIREVWSCES